MVGRKVIGGQLRVEDQGSSFVPVQGPGWRMRRGADKDWDCRVAAGLDQRLRQQRADLCPRLEAAVFCRGDGCVPVLLAQKGYMLAAQMWLVVHQLETPSWRRLAVPGRRSCRASLWFVLAGMKGLRLPRFPAAAQQGSWQRHVLEEAEVHPVLCGGSVGELSW